MSLDSPGRELEELGGLPGGREGIELTLKDAATAAVIAGIAS